MRDTRTNREQYRWALWAALVAAVGIAIAGYGCGADGRTDSGDDGATHPGEVAPPSADPGTEGTDMDAAHSAAWKEALDGLARDGDVDRYVADIQPDDAGDPLAGIQEPVAVTPAPPAPTPYAVLDTSVQLTEAQVTQLLINAGFTPDTWPRMLALGWCESKFSPNATGLAGEMGIWQVHPRWHPDATYDPQGNANAAYRISSGGYDLSAWSCKVPY